MILLRSVREKDFADLYELASILDSLNLPHERDLLKHNIRHAIASFRGTQKDKAKAIYIFVAEDLRTKKVVGTSAIFARHGAERAPHIYMEVRRETRRSRTQDIRVKHRTMQLGWTKDGPTEVGGLVVKPGYRRLPVKIGKQLSLIRFVYMAMHPGRFKKRVLCEFLPNFSRQGHSLLWEHFGGKFTKMDYHIADHLSAVNKEFILGLFPHTKIYTTLMPPSVQEILEKTGDTSLPAQKMLEQIGFRYLKQICPFDGGPHFGAALKDVRVVRRTKFVKMRLEHARCDGPRKATRVKDVPQACGLVLADKKGTVRAVQAPWVVRNDQAHLSAEVCDALEVKNGDAVTVYKIA